MREYRKSLDRESRLCAFAGAFRKVTIKAGSAESHHSHLSQHSQSNTIRKEAVKGSGSLFQRRSFMSFRNWDRHLEKTFPVRIMGVRCRDRSDAEKNVRAMSSTIPKDAGDSEVHRLGPGQRVCVATGVLSGLKGTVIEHRSSGRLLVQLQDGVYVESDAFLLQDDEAK